MSSLLSPRVLFALALVTSSCLGYRLWLAARARARTTRLHGPPSSNWLLGVTKEFISGDSGDLFEKWEKEYGSVYEVRGPFGEPRIVLTDPKALMHYFAKTNLYIKNNFARHILKEVVGKGVLWAEADDHKRQRKTLNSAFTNTAIREVVSIFFDSGYKVKAAWDARLSSSPNPNGETIIDVQKWMNCVSLDSIGIAAFGHDFGSLRGEHGIIEEAFDSMSSVSPSALDVLLALLAPIFPPLMSIPTKRQTLMKKMNRAMQNIAEGLLQKTRKDVDDGTFSTTSRSIMGALIRAESAESKSTLTEEEVLSQMKTLMLAGYETTSISMTWALIELARHPEKQDKLRKELSEFSAGNDPSYGQLMNELPYLNAILLEILRLQPPVELNNRVASHDDVIPLSTPIQTASGHAVDHITVGEGVAFMIPIRAINRSEALWGPDARVFNPERWLDNEAGLTEHAKEIQGFHHVLSFIDGPRICLGRLFAVAEFKAVLSVLIRNYFFEMRDGPETKVERFITILRRPRVVGEEGSNMPMRVRRVG